MHDSLWHQHGDRFEHGQCAIDDFHQQQHGQPYRQHHEQPADQRRLHKFNYWSHRILGRRGWRQETLLIAINLRMLFFLGDLFRQNVDEPKNGDADDRRDNDRDPRDNIGDGVQRFAVEKGSVRVRRQCQGRERDKRNEIFAATPAPVFDGLNE